MTFIFTILAGFVGMELGTLCNIPELLSNLFAIATASACIVGFLGKK